MQLEPLECMHLAAHVVHDAQAPYSLHQLVLFQGMRRARQDMQTNSTPDGPNQAFDDHRILVSLVLKQ